MSNNTNTNTSRVTAAQVPITDFQQHLRHPQQGIRVLHRKKEETYPNLDNTDESFDTYFIFEWQVRINKYPYLASCYGFFRFILMIDCFGICLAYH
jgi:hypothetical protein